MDNMRHLSTSLPRQRGVRTADLLTDFKAAAMSVTNLYKGAVNSQKQARADGYQDALDDLLAFLDKEEMGLMDGEGWRVRQWATERLDGADTASSNRDEEDDGSTTREEPKEEERSASPEVQRRPQAVHPSSSDLTEESDPAHRRVVSEPPQAPIPPPANQQTLPQTGFTFQSSHAYPSNHDRDANAEMETDNASITNVHAFTANSTPSSTETVRIIPRSRSNRHNNHNRRNGNQTPTLNFNLGSGAGSKRKIPYSDLFDISGINDGGDRKDGNGTGRGGKRRHV